MPSDRDRRLSAERARFSDLAESRTLPAWAYTDGAVLAAEEKEIFFRHWQFVGHLSVLREPGDYITASISDQNVIVIRGHDGALRAFYNVCLHRGHELVSGTGNTGRLVCPYHAWTYALDGQLVGIRRGKGTTRVARADICLSALRVDCLLDLVFVSLDPNVEPLETYAAGLAEEIARCVPGWARLRPVDAREGWKEPFACNWKALIDNYLECYHCETAHPTFCDLFRA